MRLAAVAPGCISTHRVALRRNTVSPSFGPLPTRALQSSMVHRATMCWRQCLVMNKQRMHVIDLLIDWEDPAVLHIDTGPF